MNVIPGFDVNDNSILVVIFFPNGRFLLFLFFIYHHLNLRSNQGYYSLMLT